MTDMMRGLVLTGEEVRALMRDGVVVVRRPLKSTTKIVGLSTPERWNSGRASYDMPTYDTWGERTGHVLFEADYGKPFALRCPIGQPGERRFVKETFAGERVDSVVYRATVRDNTDWTEEEIHETRWRSAMHMTRELSRTTTECTNATAEQVGGVWWWVATYKRITE